MPQIWPDLWRGDGQEVSTSEIDTTATAPLPCDYGIVATAAAVETPDDVPTIRHARSLHRKARHALRHFELGPFKIHRVALPLAAIATGVAVAYFTPHGTTPAIARQPEASSAPHPSHTPPAKKKSAAPIASPTNIPFAVSGYENSPSPSISQSWRYDGSKGYLSPSSGASKTQSQEPQPQSSHRSLPQAAGSASPTRETPPQTHSNSPSITGSAPSSTPQPSETTPQSDSSHIAPEDVSPLQTTQKNSPSP